MERKNQHSSQIVKTGEFGGVPVQLRGGEVTYYRDEGSEEQRTGGGKREVLDLDARHGPAEAIIGGNRFRLEAGSRLTIETNVSEPEVIRTERPKTLVIQRAAEANSPLYSGTAVKHFKILGVPLFQTNYYDFEGSPKTFEEIRALQQDGWEIPHVRIEEQNGNFR